jgi:hypothetical protein
MANRIDFKLSVTPIIGLSDVTEGASGAEVLSADIKGTIGGGNSNLPWTGSDISDWDMSNATPADAVHLHATSGSSTSLPTDASCDGIFIKNTGFDYDASQDNNVGTTTVAEDAGVTVTITPTSGPIIANLAGGEAIFLPNPADTAFVLGVSSGTDYPAVQYATLD